MLALECAQGWAIFSSPCISIKYVFRSLHKIFEYQTSTLCQNPYSDPTVDRVWRLKEIGPILRLDPLGYVWPCCIFGFSGYEYWIGDWLLFNANLCTSAKFLLLGVSMRTARDFYDSYIYPWGTLVTTFNQYAPRVWIYLPLTLAERG